MMYGNYSQFLIPLLALAVGFLAAQAWQLRRRRLVKAWPKDFKLNARPLLTTEERLLFRELKAALPQHVVLAKLNVLRFCQSGAGREARLWFERLQAMNVTFAICTPNGAVISVIDLDTPQRVKGQHHQRLKEAVLDSCRIRYLRCEAGHWPRPALLAQWALGSLSGQAYQQGGGASQLVAARAELAEKLQKRRVERAERTSRFQDSRFSESRFEDSSFAPDSFFVLDSRFDDSAANSGPVPLAAAPLGSAAGSAATPGRRAG